MGLAADWHRSDARRLLEDRIGSDVALINDADAAGIAEMTFGEGARERGVVIVLTLGTFIGSALFNDGRLLPNTELGQLEVGGSSVETWLGGRARLARGLSWREWGEEFSAFLDRLDAWFSPDRVVLAGGMTRAADAFMPYLECKSALKLSRFSDTAGIIGAGIVSRADIGAGRRIDWARQNP
jgi:polyphosphate glucokinase